MKVIINYDIEKINAALKAFYNATGINITLLDEEVLSISTNQNTHNRYCRAIQEDNRTMCKMSDKELIERCRKSKKAEMHVCHAGLIDIAVPIIYDGNILAYIILGQMKNEENFLSVWEKVKNLNLDFDKMEKYYGELTFFNKEKIESVEKIAVMLAKYLLLENMLSPDFNINIKRATDFIMENLDKKLTISYIAKSVNISKSVLYRNFHSCFNCTISEYINKMRIKRAEYLLKEKEMPIEEVSRSVGFSSVSYFGRVFKEKNGVSPLAFRKIKEV